MQSGHTAAKSVQNGNKAIVGATSEAFTRWLHLLYATGELQDGFDRTIPCNWLVHVVSCIAVAVLASEASIGICWDLGWSVGWFIRWQWSCVLQKKVEPINMPFGMMYRVGPRNHVIRWGSDPSMGKASFCGNRWGNLTYMENTVADSLSNYFGISCCSSVWLADYVSVLSLWFCGLTCVV